MKEFEGGKEAAEKLMDWIEALAMILAHWIMQNLFRRRRQHPQPVPARHHPLPVEPKPEPQAASTRPEPRTVWNDRALRAKAKKAGERLKAESERRWAAVYLKRYLTRKMEPGTAKRPHPKARKLPESVLAWANTIDQETAAEIVASPTDRLARDIGRIEAEGAEIAAKAIDPTVIKPNASPHIRPAWLAMQEAAEAAQAAAGAQAIIDAEIAGPQIDQAELEAVPEGFGGIPPEIDPDDLEPLPPTSPQI